NRKKLAIGIYPLEAIKLPINFLGKKPEDIKFQPLESRKEMTGKQILSQHPTGREYGNLLKDCEVFPIFEKDDDDLNDAAYLLFQIADRHSSLYFACDEQERIRKYASCRVEAISLLVDATSDDDSYVCSVALEALGRIGAIEALPIIFASFRNENDIYPEHSLIALDFLYSHKLLNPTETVPMLVKSLCNESPDVRDYMVSMLGEYKTESVKYFPELLRLLSDKESGVRCSAADALAEIGALDALPGLERALEVEKDPFAVEYIKEAIRKLTAATISGLR
ncbi:MAG: HEAT repeat domain-containing protein, partial [Planctomycetota bacterium]